MYNGNRSSIKQKCNITREASNVLPQRTLRAGQWLPQSDRHGAVGVVKRRLHHKVLFVLKRGNHVVVDLDRQAWHGPTVR